MTTIPKPPADTEAPVLSPAERRARISALQSELELLDTARDHSRDVLRSLLTLQHTLDANPVRFRSLYDRNVDACDHYMRHVAALTAEINRLDAELTALCSRPKSGELLRPVLVDSFGEIVDDDGMVTPGILAELAGGAR